MSRITVSFTLIGLLGLVTAMLSALGLQPSANLLVLGVATMGAGFLGAVIGAVVDLRHAAQPTR